MSYRRAQWVKWFPRDFLDGTEYMRADDIGVYTIILNLIYAKDGPIPDDKEYLSRKCGCRPTSLQKSLDRLSTKKKLIMADGMISNPRAEIEITEREEQIKKLSETRSKAGKMSAKSRKNLSEKTNEINVDVQQNKKEKKIIELELDPLTPKGPVAATPKPPRPASVGPKAERIDKGRPMIAINLSYAASRGVPERRSRRAWDSFVHHYARLPDKDRYSKSVDWNVDWEGWILRLCERENIEPYADPVEKPKPSVYPREVWESSVRLFRNTGRWHQDLGPDPDDPNCKAPKDLLVTRG